MNLIIPPSHHQHPEFATAPEIPMLLHVLLDFFESICVAQVEHEEVSHALSL